MSNSQTQNSSDISSGIDVANLNEDLLWSIFQLNTNLFRSQVSLRTLRRSSQVCQTWRNIIINSPSLWGNVVDLTRLLSKSRAGNSRRTKATVVIQYSQTDGYLDNHPWMKEIIRRSGMSPLCIKAHRIGGEENILLALRLIDVEWSRIRKLDMSVDVDNKIDITKWNPLSRPAPALEHLHLSVIGYADLTVPAVFTDKAPVLVNLSANAIVNIQPHLPWLGNIKSLEIVHKFPVLDALKIVEKLSSIQTLTIRGTQRTQDSDASLPTNHPSGLRLLVLTDIDLQSASRLLDHIQLPSGCSLEANTWLKFQDENVELVDAALRPFVSYAQRFFQRYCPTTAKIGRLGHIYGDSPHEFLTESPDGSSRFTLSIQMRHHTTCADTFLKAFCFPELSSVTDLTIRASEAAAAVVESLRPLMPNVTILGSNDFFFMHAFNRNIRRHLLSSVSILPGSENTINEVKITNLFPLLSNLRISSLYVSIIPGQGHLCRLIQALCEEDRPIEILDLTKNPPEMSPDLSILEEVQGLKVLWKGPLGNIEEYIRGSGEPDKLPNRNSIRPDPLRQTLGSLFGNLNSRS